MKLSLDANVFIYAYITGENIKNERRRREWVQLHEKADVLYTDVLKGKHVVIIPSVIVAEVCAVISRLLRAFESYVDVRLLKDMSLDDIKLMPIDVRLV